MVLEGGALHTAGTFPAPLLAKLPPNHAVLTLIKPACNLPALMIHAVNSLGSWVSYSIEENPPCHTPHVLFP